MYLWPKKVAGNVGKMRKKMFFFLSQWMQGCTPGDLCVPLLGFFPHNFELFPMMVAPGDSLEDGEATGGQGGE